MLPVFQSKWGIAFWREMLLLHFTDNCSALPETQRKNHLTCVVLGWNKEDIIMDAVLKLKNLDDVIFTVT